MEQSLKGKMPSVDDCCHYLASGAHLYPTVYDHYLERLAALERRGKISLIPTAIFERFHRRIRGQMAA